MAYLCLISLMSLLFSFSSFSFLIITLFVFLITVKRWHILDVLARLPNSFSINICLPYLHESVGGTDYVNSREISCEMVLDPDPKGYTIVPTTIHPGEEAPFVLSVFTKASITLELMALQLFTSPLV